MKLIYRGQTYEYDATQTGAVRQQAQQQRYDRLPESLDLIYRGSTYRLTAGAPAEVAPRPSGYALIYRGNTYWIGEAPAQTSEQMPVSIQAPKRVNTIRKTARVDELSIIHQTNLRNNLQRRIQAARAQGNQPLLTLLESEERQLVRN